MVTGLREFLETKAGKGVAAVLILIAAIAIFVSVRDNLGPAEAAALSRERVFICSDTGKTFVAEVTPGMGFPVRSPHSGAHTGYVPELCYWTADGTIAGEPTYVLLNRHRGEKGPTFCPDCDRLVVSDNPPPEPDKPPPTRAEHATSRRPTGGALAGQAAADGGEDRA